jgi:uncharacterized protein (TIGR02118 family)
MDRAFVIYQGEVDPARYEQHVPLCNAVPGATAFRHGPVFGAPMGEPEFHYYAEFEYPDRETLESSVRSPEMGATVKDAMAMGVPFKVHFAELD